MLKIMKPLGKRLVIRLIDKEKTTESGLTLIMETPLREAIVVAKGSDVTEEIEVGQTVLYEPGSTLPVGGGDNLLISESNIVAVCSPTSLH